MAGLLGRPDLRGLRIGITLSGGNVDLARFRELTSSAVIRTGDLAFRTETR